MSEITGAVTMYDAVEEIKNLNRVEGFDPRQYIRTLTGDSGVAKQYLDVVYRKLWFRLKNPDGKIVKKLLRFTEQTAIVEARVYLHKDDAEDSFISNALAQKFATQDEQFGNKFLELAETAAVGRALADAGYGLQFADLEGELDPHVVDAPLEVRNQAAADYTAGGFEEASGSGTVFQDNQQMTQNQTLSQNQQPMQNQTPVQYQQEPQNRAPAQYQQAPRNQAPARNQQQAQNQTSGAAANNSQNQADSQQYAFDTASMTTGMPPVFGGSMPIQNPAQTAQNQAAGGQNQQPAQNQAPTGQIPNMPAFTKDMPVEQIYAGMDYQTAAAIVIPVGYHRGKTLGQVAFDKPADLAWYMNGGYKGPDNILRAASKYLIDTAANRAA